MITMQQQQKCSKENEIKCQIKKMGRKEEEKIFIILSFLCLSFSLKYRQLYDNNATATARLQRKENNMYSFNAEQK